MSNCLHCHNGMCCAEDDMRLPIDFQCSFKSVDGFCMATDEDLIESCCECEDKPAWKDGYCKACFEERFGDETPFSKRGSRGSKEKK